MKLLPALTPKTGTARKRKKPRKPLTPLQENRLLKIILLLLLGSVLYLFFAPNTGIYTLLRLHRQAIVMEEQTKALLQVNQELKTEIERLKNDPVYLEQIARQRFGMLKENEEVFVFPDAKKHQREPQ